MLTRCRWPPDSSCGQRCRARPPARPAPAGPGRAVARSPQPVGPAGARRRLRTVIRGSSESCGSWKIICRGGGARGGAGRARRRVHAREADRARRSGASRPSRRARSSTCPSPTRRSRPGSRRGRRRALTPSTARTGAGGAALRTPGRRLDRSTRTARQRRRRARPGRRAPRRSSEGTGEVELVGPAARAAWPAASDRRARAAQARVAHVVAPGVEAAAGRHVGGRGHPAADRRAAAAAVGQRGMACSSPDVYGCRGRSSSLVRRRCSTISPAYITSTRSAQLGDHAEVVGDEQDRRAVLVAERRAAARGSGPGWSRRARSSARRR